MPHIATTPPNIAGGAACARIGVFDSGLGGLSVLQALLRQLPGADVLYVADSGHAPYGERDVAHITARSEHITRFLLSKGAQVIVVACNTATAAAVQHLRNSWPNTPIVGVEPGIKPALALSASGRIGVMATPATLDSTRFRALLDRLAAKALVTLQPCPGLAREIERGQLDSPQLRQLVHGFTAPLKAAGVDTVVLGCTHYPFVRHLFQAELGPDVAIVDTSEAVARQAARQAPEALGRPSAPGHIYLWSSGPPEHLAEVVRHWLDIKAEARPLP
jgi:glutamate racemase